MNAGTLPALDPDSNHWNVIIETPRGKRAKLAYDEKSGLFELHKLLPLGMVFPFDFGFIPSTLGGDGDPLDVLVLTEGELFPGCLVHARLIGGLKAVQIERGKPKRNDRLLATPVLSSDENPVRSVDELGKKRLREIEEFFVNYQRLEGKEFKVLDLLGPKKVDKLARKAIAKQD